MLRPQVLIVGGGMIAHDQLLPSLYHMQRQGRIGRDRRVRVALRHGARPGQRRQLCGAPFPASPSARTRSSDGPPSRTCSAKPSPRLPPRQIVVVAVPDQLHFDVVMAALAPRSARLLRQAAGARIPPGASRSSAKRAPAALLVGVEYHKRFDDRSLMARRKYREGPFGEFRLGTACLLEKWYYRHSNFQNWMTAENSDAFTYIGCHYVDLVHFITGLLPVAVSVYGIRDRFPNGNEGFLWTDARVIWSNGACLNVQNGLGFPDDAPGTNTQGLTLYCRGEDRRRAARALGSVSRPEV